MTDAHASIPSQHSDSGGLCRPRGPPWPTTRSPGTTEGTSAAEAQVFAIKYGYVPLDVRYVEMRVLDLVPGQFEGPIQVRLSIYSLGDKPYYEALSYTWGASNANRTISVNGVEGFAITDNLFAALKRFRDPYEERPLWIDAICINQLDDRERAYQVGIMGSIYTRAAEVLVWLGDHTLEEPETHSDCTSDESIYEDCTNAGSLDPSKEWGPEHRASNGALFRCLGRTLSITRPSWWQRVWTVQEYDLAPTDAVLFCFGPHELGLDAMERMMSNGFVSQGIDSTAANQNQLIYDFQSALGQRSVLRRHRLGVQKSRRSRFHDEGIPVWRRYEASSVVNEGLLYVWTYTPHCSVTDPHDHIYGRLGLLDRSFRRYIDVSYTREVWQTMAQATFAEIMVNRCFDILGAIPLGRGLEYRHANEPSWVVPFHRLSRLPGFEEYVFATFNMELSFFAPLGENVLRILRPKSVPGESAWQQPFNVRVSSDNRYLTVQGRRMGTIRDVLPLDVRWCFYFDHSATELTSVTWIAMSTILAQWCSPANHDSTSAPESSLSRSAKDIKSRTADLTVLNDKLQREIARDWGPVQLHASICAEAVMEWLTSEVAKSPALERRSASSPSTPWRLTKQKIVAWWEYLSFISDYPCLFITDGGLVGLGSSAIKPGDHVTLLNTMTAPVVLRKQDRHRQEPASYSLQGFAYIHDMLDVGSLQDSSTLEHIVLC